VSGQCFTKKAASSHELICEQRVRPSHLNAGFASSSGGSFAFASGAWGGERVWYTANPITAANTTAANPAKLPERDEAFLGWRSRFGEPALARLTGARPVRGSAEAIASAEINVPTRITHTAFVRPSLPV
jgi:hypothetical protein